MTAHRAFFWLHDIRILKAHNASDRKQELHEELKRFGIKPAKKALATARFSTESTMRYRQSSLI